MTKVELRNGEPQQKMFRRFRKSVVSSGVMGEVRKRRWFISKNEQRRIDKKKAIRRLKRRKMKKKPFTKEILDHSMTEEIYTRGDWIVHANYGVGQVKGKNTRILDGEERTFLKVRTVSSNIFFR